MAQGHHRGGYQRADTEPLVNRARYIDEIRRPCVDVPGLFFPPSGRRDLVREAKALCATCGVRVACLETALAGNEQHGTWGGIPERERRQIRRSRYVPALKVLPGLLLDPLGDAPAVLAGPTSPVQATIAS